MRKMRLPVVLNETTWIITESASARKTPWMMAQTTSFLVSTASAPSAAAQRQRADVAHEDADAG